MDSGVPKSQSNWHTRIAQLIQALAFASMASFKPLFLVLLVRSQGVLRLLPSTAVGLPQTKKSKNLDLTHAARTQQYPNTNPPKQQKLI